MPSPDVPDPRTRIAVVLVRSRNPGNIGAVARAMHDFGFTDLRLVNDYIVPFEAARSAIDATDVLASARHLPTVAEAVADCGLVIGTTAVGERTLDHPLLQLPAAAPTLLAATNTGRVALLFGSEKTGLSNDELSHCHALLTIPMYQHPDIRHPSMNLGQAVAVCLYELVRNPGQQPSDPAPVSQPLLPPQTSAADLERLRDLLSELLAETEYLRHHPANSDPSDIRRLLLRASISPTDLPVWLGILRQALWKLRRPHPGPPPPRET